MVPLMDKLRALAIKNSSPTDPPNSAEPATETPALAPLEHAQPEKTVSGVDSEKVPISPSPTPLPAQTEDRAPTPPIPDVKAPPIIPAPATIAPPPVPTPLASQPVPLAHTPLPQPDSALLLHLVRAARIAKLSRPKASPSDQIILTSEDDTPFITSRALLAAHSAVFAAAADLSSITAPGNSRLETIPLSSSTSAGLALVLAVITIIGSVGPKYSWVAHDTLRKAVLSFPLERMSARDIEVIAEGFACARAYDITSFGRYLIWGLLVRQRNLTPMIGYTLLAVTARRFPAHSGFGMPAYTAKMLLGGVLTIPYSYRKVVQTHAPEHISRYTSLVARYWKAYMDLRVDLRTDERLTDLGEDDYARRCRGWETVSEYHPQGHVRIYDWDGGWERPTYPDCAAHKAEPLWWVLRQKAADRVYLEVFKNGESPTNYAESLPLVTQMVPCRKCARRLARTFEVSVRRFRAVSYTY